MEDWVFGEPQRPRPLEPTREISLLRTEVRSDFVVKCCACNNTGKLTCSRCHAVRYCGQECQRNGFVQAYTRMDTGELTFKATNGWKDHKDLCNTIRKLCQETTAAADVLVKDFGGEETFFRTPLVKKGRFRYLEAPWGDEPEELTTNASERYIMARQKLVRVYAKAGEDGLNAIAFRLAAENMLDVLCLTYNQSRRHQGEHVRFQYCGWMVAGGMDQEALNYICYFNHREISQEPLPYLDISKDEDVEGSTYLEPIRKATAMGIEGLWFHDYMMIALIKYKRLQALLVERRKGSSIWGTFMMGTHPRVGQRSNILRLRGKNPVLELTKSYVVDLSLEPRIKALAKQIQEILALVNERNPLLIPGILDRNSIPDDPPYNEDEDEDELDESFDLHGDDPHDARWAFANYGIAWNMSRAYSRVLQLFQDTGKVLVGEAPVEGFLQAAFDVDPSNPFGADDVLKNLKL